MTALDVLTILARLLCAGTLCLLGGLAVRGVRDLQLRGQAPVHRGRSWESREPRIGGRL